MTTWSSRTQPTPANVRKRLKAAADALEGALALMDQRPPTSPNRACQSRARNALAWTADAIAHTTAKPAR